VFAGVATRVTKEPYSGDSQCHQKERVAVDMAVLARAAEPGELG
jgi:hypothetical protein